MSIRRAHQGLQSIAASCAHLHTLNVALSPGLCMATHDAVTAMARAGLPLKVLVLNRCDVTDETVRSVPPPFAERVRSPRPVRRGAGKMRNRGGSHAQCHTHWRARA
jgi:hypothetical protein